jgi:hypothetical protein
MSTGQTARSGPTIEGYKRILPHKDPNDIEHRLDGLRKAGLRET